MELNKIKSSNLNWGDAANDLNQNFGKINNAIEQVKNVTTRNKGYFSSDTELKSTFPSANVGDIAYVGSAYPYQTWAWKGSEWEKKNDNGGQESVNLGNYYTKEDTDKKLSELESEVILSAEFDFSDGISEKPFLFRKGHTYKVTNKGNVTCAVATRLTQTSENLDVVQSIYANSSKTFVATSDANYIRCAYSTQIEVSDLSNVVNELKSGITQHQSDVQDLSNVVNENTIIAKNAVVDKAVIAFPYNGNKYIPYNIVKGVKYRVTNIGESIIVVSTKGEPNGENIDVVQSLYPYISKIFVATSDANYLNCAYNASIIIEPINELAEVVRITNDFTDYVTKGFIATASIIDINTIKENPAFGHFVAKVEQGDVVKVYGAGGESARLLMITNADKKVLYQSGVNYTGEESYNVVEDGYAVFNVSLTSVYSIIIESASSNIGNHLDRKLDKADYANELSTEFTESGGKTISFKIVKGRTYRVTNVRSNGALIFKTKEMHTSAYIDSTTSNLYGGQSYTFVASASADLVYVYMNNVGVAKIEQLDTISKEIESIKSAALNPLASFDSAEGLIDVADIFGEFDFSNGMYQSDAMEQIIAKFDVLKEQHSDYISKHDSLTFASKIYSDIEYPWYTRGINAEEVRTIDYGNGRTKNITFKVTPLYNIPVYKLSSNDNIGKSYYADSAEYPKKKIFLYAGGHGNENFAPYNLYQFAYNLCKAPTGNYAKLRATCEFYILPYLNGYGCYHTMRCNANRVDVERAFPTSRFTPSDYDTIESNTACTYTGEVGGKEFETKLIMGCIQAINPSLTFSCHNYGKESSSQFYANTSYEDMFKGYTKALLNVISPICKKFEEYYGRYSTFNQNLSVRYDGISYPYIWMRENGYYGGLVEIGNSINFLGGSSNSNADSKPSFNADVALIAEIELRHILCAVLNQIVA